MVALKRFEHVVDIVDDSGCQNACLVEDLRKMSLRSICLHGFYLVVPDTLRHVFKEEQHWSQLHRQIEPDCLQTFGVRSFKTVLLVWYQRIAHVHAHWKDIARFAASFKRLGPVSKYRHEQIT